MSTAVCRILSRAVWFGIETDRVLAVKRTRSVRTGSLAGILVDKFGRWLILVNGGVSS
jgi:hypothetical protein